MTLEEIIDEIKWFKTCAEVEARVGKESDWIIGYQEGKISAYEKCLRLLENQPTNTTET